MNIERGDSVKFGEKWCRKNGREELVNQVIKFTPQWFEADNFETEYPGIYDEKLEKADSIYQLFGTNFETFMDCELIKGTAEDIETYEKIIRDKNDAEAKNYAKYVLAGRILKGFFMVSFFVCLFLASYVITYTDNILIAGFCTSVGLTFLAMGILFETDK